MAIPCSKTHRFRRPKILIPLLALFLCIGLAAAAVFTLFYANNTATVKTPDVQLAAGTDSSSSTTFPAASVTVATTHDYAAVAFSIFPSATNTPQPATYYTDLLNIKNVGTAAHTIKAITVTALTGVTSLGSITVYYYASQTDTPGAGSLGSATITSTSTAPVTIFSGTQSIAAAGTQYIEVVGYAASGATVDTTVTMQVSIQWV